MKTFLVVFAAVCAMAFAQSDHSVRVADQPNQGFVITNPDPGFYQPSNGNGNGLNIVPDSGFHNPSGSGGVQPSFGPTFVSTDRPYPYKNYNNPLARGGK